MTGDHQGESLGAFDTRKLKLKRTVLYLIIKAMRPVSSNSSAKVLPRIMPKYRSTYAASRSKFGTWYAWETQAATLILSVE